MQRGAEGAAVGDFEDGEGWVGSWGCGRGLVKGCWREGEGVSLRWRVVGGWVDLQGQTNSRGCLLAACWVAFGFFGTSFFQLGLFEFGPLAFFWLARSGGGMRGWIVADSGC